MDYVKYFAFLHHIYLGERLRKGIPALVVLLPVNKSQLSRPLGKFRQPKLTLTGKLPKYRVVYIAQVAFGVSHTADCFYNLLNLVLRLPRFAYDFVLHALRVFGKPLQGRLGCLGVSLETDYAGNLVLQHGTLTIHYVNIHLVPAQ